ncbi:MAG: hypothetical protein ACJA1S_002156 [Cellvibrionaceae bacterium]
MNTLFLKVLLVMPFLKKNILWILFSLLFFASMALYFVVSDRYMLSTKSIAFFDQSTDIEKVYASIKWPDQQKNKIRVIYFWQAYCPCDATVMPHFKELYKAHTKDAVEFYLADISTAALSSSGESLINLPAASSSKRNQPFDNLLSQELTNLFRPFVSHTPSVAIWSQNNELTYYGPHNLGYVCNAETSFVKKIIDSLLQNIYSKNTNIVGKGCFCKV